MAKQTIDISEYNAWRNSLPKHCWTCSNFDKCSPNYGCTWNPNFRKRRKPDV